VSRSDVPVSGILETSRAASGAPDASVADSEAEFLDNGRKCAR
jgi:hypothetical protein